MIDANEILAMYNFGYAMLGFFIGMAVFGFLYAMYEMKRTRDDYTKTLDDKQYRKYMEFRGKV
jgi:hypothetical protein